MNSSKTYEEINKEELRKMYDTFVEKSGVLSMKVPEDEEIFTLNKFVPPERYFYKRKIAEMIKLSGIKKGDHVLEVGSTAGHITFILGSMGYKLTAVDISPKSIECANRVKEAKNVSNVEFSVSDAEDLRQFPDNYFDAVFSFSVLRYVPNPQKALNEMRRVVKKGGAVVVDFPNKFCPWFKIIRKALKKAEHIHDHLFSPKQVKEMFLRAGLKRVKASIILYTYKRAPQVIYLILRAAGSVLEKIPLVNQTAAIIMCRGIKK